MSLAGARSTWSNYTLDGITNTDINFNLYIVLPSVEALQEFKVQTGIYPAEFGRAAGQINVSTKGGTNEYHGSAFEFLRNDKLDARPYFFKDPESPTQTAPVKAPYRQNQYGFTLGGPGADSEGIQRQEPAVLHVELRGIQVAHALRPQFFTTHDAGDAGRRFLGGPDAAAGSADARPDSEPDGTASPSRRPRSRAIRFPRSRFNPASVYLLEQVRSAAEPAADRSAESQLSVPAEDAGRQGPVHRRIDFNESAELAMVRPLQLDRRADDHSRRSS